MLQSMTGFGSAAGSFKAKRGTLEISADVKTVNSKYLDINLRSSKQYISFDPAVAKFVRSRLKRGRVDVALSMKVVEGQAREVSINTAQAEAVHKALSDISAKLGMKDKVELEDMLRVPDWIESRDTELDLKEEWAFVEEVLTKALDQVIEARKNEGTSLKTVLQTHLENFKNAFSSIATDHEKILEDLRTRVRDRVEELYGKDGFDPQRLEQEIVLSISRSDFREEVDRIGHHLQTLNTLIESSGEVGRKVEFVLQELQREVNTLGTKCPDASVTPKVVELKTNIERMREQVLNVE
jgi:uncharacterized protein (TIGR00255 family)